MNKIKKIAILCNNKSSDISSRPELLKLIHDYNIQPYICGIFDNEINSFYCVDTAIFLPIVASRANTNPLMEIKSILSVRKQIKKERINACIIYGVKNHAAMAIGSYLGGARRIICIVNGSGNLFRVSGIKGKLLRFISFPMLKIAYKLSSYVSFQNRDDLKLFKVKKLISNRTKTFVTGGSGVNLDKYPSSKLPKENKFLFLARITPTKGIKEYIKAAYILKNKYPDCIFDIYGNVDSAVESSIGEILNKAVNDNVVNYHGKTDNVPKVISECRYFIYPSYYPEGISRCLLQALSCSRPIITCNTSGCKETVINGLNGFLVEKQNVQELCDKMEYFIKHPIEVEKMAVESRNLAKKNFDVNKINKIIINKFLDKV